jgi:hypothetical protein
MPSRNRNVSLPKAALVSVISLVSTLSAQDRSDRSQAGQWRIAGQNLSNTWSQPAEHLMSPLGRSLGRLRTPLQALWTWAQ